MIVFAGPSLVGVSVPEGIEMRRPAKQGDIYLATLESPEPIGLIDGFFEGVLAVWHKEILWALAHEIPVLGASSMGALRAAELDHYGMIGVGAIYEGYRDGLYEDDDEVALHHAPAALGYAPVSIAMVNIRASMEAAEAAGVISVEDGARITAAAKALYYGERRWDKVLAGEEAALRERLKAWLSENEVDQKKIDAQALLDRMISEDFARSLEPTPFRFEHTRLWDRATEEWERKAGIVAPFRITT